MSTSRPLLLVAALLLAACKDDPPPPSGPEPMRAPAVAQDPDQHPGQAPSQTEGATEETSAGEADDQARAPLPERPRADPDIERALDLISGSGLRFLDPPSEPDGRPSEYTAEQFAGMLRTKWDWIGYDLTELEPWLDAIATRSFKTNLAYQVVLADGTSSELRPWLDAQLRSEAANDG